jgi:hypothetical protein
MRAREFLIERVSKQAVSNKLQFIKDKVDSGQLTDPKTVDYIYKILQKPEIQQAISSYLGTVQTKDQDVAAFQQRNNNMLADVIRKLPVQKEKLDQFVKRWAKGTSFVNVDLLTSGNKGTLQQLIPDPTAFVAFETFEKMRSQVTLHKKGAAGYGEFGLSMLSPSINLKAPGDIQIDGSPVEVKGNDARLYADERAGIAEAEINQIGAPTEIAPVAPPQPAVAKTPVPMGQPAAKQASQKVARGSAPGALNNVLTGILSKDPNVIEQVTQAFTSRGVENIDRLIKKIQRQGDAGLDTLKVEWWRAGFNSYYEAIQMPIMLIGFGQFLISDKADDFISWGCLPNTITSYGYMYGRQAGQSRETYPKIFVPGHNK